MWDATEAANKGITKPKLSTKHLYAAIEHRVIDHPAYADLTFAARSVLLLIARQLTKDTWESVTGQRTLRDIRQYVKDGWFDNSDKAFQEWRLEQSRAITERVCGYEKAAQIDEELRSRRAEINEVTRRLRGEG